MRKNRSDGPCVYLALYMLLSSRDIEDAVKHVRRCGSCYPLIAPIAESLGEGMKHMLSILAGQEQFDPDKKETVQ